MGRTEKVQNCLSPKFAKKFVVDYYFEIVQKLKFGVYDIDNKTIDLTDDDFLGELECTLGQVRFPPLFLFLQGWRFSVFNISELISVKWSKQDFAGAKLVGLILCCKRTLQCYHVADEALTSLISSCWFDSYQCNVTSCVHYARFVICLMVCRLLCITHLFSCLHSEPIHSNYFAVANCLCQSACFFACF